MKRLFVLFAILLLSVTVYSADLLRPTGYEAITVDATAGGVSLTTAKYLTASTSKILSDYAVLSNETAQIRFTVDGTAPTSTVGLLLQPNQSWLLDSFEELKNFRAIRVSDTSASLKVIYYKRYKQ